MKTWLTRFLIVSLVLLVGHLGILVTDGQSASGDQIKLELTSTLAPGSCLEQVGDKVKELVEEKTNGRITIVRYPSGELYGPKAEIEAVIKGNIAMALMHGAYVGGHSPALELMGGFGGVGCWDDGDHYWRFCDLPEVREIADNEFKSKLNAKVLGILNGGSSLIGNSRRPIHRIEDFHGLKIRCAGVSEATMYKTLGAVPTELSSKEVYMALQRGTIDGAKSTPYRFYASKWYEVTQYVTQDYGMPWFSFWLAINNDIWSKLSKEDQQLLSDVGRQVEAFSRECGIGEEQTSYDELKGLVKELYFLPQEEVARMTEIVRPAMHDLILERNGKELGGRLWDLLIKARK